MKYINLILISLVSTTCASTFKQEDSWIYNGRLNGYLQKVDVENKGSDKEGFSQSQELNLRVYGPFKDGNAGVELRGRETNDNRIQKNNAELLLLKAYFKNKNWNYELGDVSASMNPYIFSGSLKGIKVEHFGNQKSENWDYKLISGVKKSPWRETYQLVENESLDTLVGALEAKYTHERAKEVKFSLAAISDDLDSGDNSTDLGKEGMSLGVDGKWRFSKYITLKGRAALSKSTDDMRNNKKKSTNSAIKLSLHTKPILSILKSDFSYQRISPNFISVAGSASQDKEEFQNMTRWTINKELSSKLSLKAKRDNLNGQLSDTQNTYYEALNFIYRPKVIKGGTLDFKLSNKDVEGRGSNTNRYTIGLNGNLRQKSGFRYGVGYDYSHYDDKNNDSLGSITNNIRTILGYKKKLSKDSSYRFTITTDVQNIRQNSNSDNRLGFKLDTGYNFNKKLSMDLSYLSRYSYKEESNDTTNTTYQFRTTYKVDDKGKQTVRLLLEKRDYDVENDSISSYNEHIGKLSYVYNF